MEVPERVDAIFLRRSHGMRNVGIAIALAGFLLAFAIQGDMRLVSFIGLVTVGSALALLGLEGTRRRVAASLDAQGVWVDEKLVVGSRTIRSGWIERGPEGSNVYLDRGLRPAARLDAHDDVEARALLRALARDPSQSLVRFSSISPLAVLVGSALGQVFAHGLFGHGRPPLLSFGASLALVVTFVIWKNEISIGADGVLLSGPVRRRFVSFADIESAVVEDVGKVVMRTRAHGAIVQRLRPAAAVAAVEQIQSSMASIGPHVEPMRQQLRREGPNVNAWLARLRTLAGRGSYRAVGFVGDALWRIMGDPGATGSERAGAAVVVGAVATPEERARLREAAARIASPAVRVAIERAADPSDEGELAVALAAIDEVAGEGA
jgi:hypothetical protein